MAAHIPTTPPGVNAPGLSGLSLMHGAVPVPTPLLTAETVAMLDVIERQDRDTRRPWPRPQARARLARRCSSVRTRIRS